MTRRRQALGRAGEARVAEWYRRRGYRVVAGGTDNHMVLINVLERGLTGVIAERALEQCNIIVNKNRLPGDQKSARVTSGIRLGTNSLALRGMSAETIGVCAELVHLVLEQVEPDGDIGYQLSPAIISRVRQRTAALCRQFPIANYPSGS